MGEGLAAGIHAVPGGWLVSGWWVRWSGVGWGEWCTLSCTALLSTADLLGAPDCQPASCQHCSCTAVLTLC
jgi:hypothetical protein